MSVTQFSQKQGTENQRIIEEWMKRNHSGRIIVGSNKVSGVAIQNKAQNEKKSPHTVIKVVKCDDKSQSPTKTNILFNKQLPSIKRHSTPADAIKSKIVKWSSPAISIQLEPANKTVNSVNPKSEEKKSCFNSKPTTIVLKQVPKPGQPLKYLTSKLASGHQSSLKNVIPTKRVGVDIQNGKNHAVLKKNIESRQLKNKQDVYSSIQDNYKYLLTPKHWSVTEFVEDAPKQCIVFSKSQVLNENDKLITVMQKSLIIDKGGTIHYSVYGLPVDVKGTILPDVLDNIKKLLSIVHIFDKMQVCKGLGDDLLIVKTDNLLKDICQIWRHTNCKLLLVKADQCQICLDTRNILLEKEMLFKSEILATDCLSVIIKEEHD